MEINFNSIKNENQTIIYKKIGFYFSLNYKKKLNISYNNIMLFPIKLKLFCDL